MSHKKKHASPGGVNLGLIITPMLDMSFQILAFFIMTYHPAAMEGHIPGSLVPPEDFAKKSKDNTPAPADEALSVPEDMLDPSLSEAITVKVKAVEKGQEMGTRVEGTPSQIFLKTGLETDAEMVYDLMKNPNEKPEIGMKELERRLKEMLKKGSNKANIKIAADADLRQQYVMLVYDTCKRAGFDKLHFVPPPVLNSKIKR
jgi:biopolymer transport protein ExbD